jgi:hypothetical protein
MIELPKLTLVSRFGLVTLGTCHIERAAGGSGSVAGQKERTSPASESLGYITSGTPSKPRRRGGAPQ